jgi:hypothetical protein
MTMPHLPGSNPAIITEENEEETAKGENYVSCFLNYFDIRHQLLMLCAVKQDLVE